jgi:hypothetical protein
MLTAIPCACRITVQDSLARMQRVQWGHHTTQLPPRTARLLVCPVVRGAGLLSCAFGYSDLGTAARQAALRRVKPSTLGQETV